MKLASFNDGSPEGRLVVVSRDLTFCADARHIAPTLGAALADWAEVAPELERIARGVESGGQPVERFHERLAHAPLAGTAADPRAAIRVDGTAVDLPIGLLLLPADPAHRDARLFALTCGDAASPAAVSPDELEAGATLVVTHGGAAPERRAAAFDPAAHAGGVVLIAPSQRLRVGETLRVELRDAAGHSIFGAIERLAEPGRTATAAAPPP